MSRDTGHSRDAPRASRQTPTDAVTDRRNGRYDHSRKAPETTLADAHLHPFSNTSNNTLPRWLAAGTLLWCLLLLAAPAGGQVPDLLGDVDNWCITHSPCDSVSHGAITVGASVALAELTGWETEDARWVPVGLYVAKEVSDHARWGWDQGWGNSALDLPFTAAGAWAAPHVGEWLGVE